MKQEDKEKKSAYLRGQKDNPTGEYRQLLIETYNCIADLIAKSEKRYCKTSCADICDFFTNHSVFDVNSFIIDKDVIINYIEQTEKM